MKENNQGGSGKSIFEIDIGNYSNAIWCIVVTMATGLYLFIFRFFFKFMEFFQFQFKKYD